MARPPITSRHNPRVKAAAALRERAERTARGQFLIDGTREVLRALDAAVVIDELFVCASPALSDAAARVVERAAAVCPAVWEVAPEVFERLAFGERRDGVVAVARQFDTSLDRLRLAERPLVGVLERVEKPGNLGAVLRSADAAGVAALVVCEPGTDWFNPNVVRASVGTLFTVPVAAATVEATRIWLRSLGLPLFAARADAGTAYTAARLDRGAAFILGAEATGLSDAWRGPDVTPIHIPMRGAADSLNVSVTAALLFFEARRQLDARSEAESPPR